MARVTSQEVCEIITTTIAVEPFIATATLVVDEELAGKGLSVGRLREIELYLAAHFVTLNDPRAKSEGSADQRVTYQGVTGSNLDASHYGQMAKTLDTTGTLSRAELRKAVFEVI